jgi:hypothetical protein
MNTHLIRLIAVIGALVTTGCQSISHRRAADPEVAIRHFEANLAPAKKCADDLVKKKKDREGEISVQWTVNDKGEVLNPLVAQNTFGDLAVGDCFLSLLQRLKFPPTQIFTKTTVTYAFRWTSLVERASPPTKTP